MFTTLLVQPLFNGLIIIYNYLPWHDIGIATIILTILIRLIFYPLFQKATVSQMKMNKIQPKMKELQEKYKHNFKEKAEAIQNLYRESKVNPFSSFTLLLIQIPIMFALYKVFMGGFEAERLNALLYAFVDNTGIINKTFINIIDITEKCLPLAVITAVAQFIQTKLLMPKAANLSADGKNKATKGGFGQEFGNMFSKQMLYMGPVFTLLILANLPSVLAIYWLTNSLVAIGQQYFINKKLGKEITQ